MFSVHGYRMRGTVVDALLSLGVKRNYSHVIRLLKSLPKPQPENKKPEWLALTRAFWGITVFKSDMESVISLGFHPNRVVEAIIDAVI